MLAPSPGLTKAIPIELRLLSFSVDPQANRSRSFVAAIRRCLHQYQRQHQAPLREQHPPVLASSPPDLLPANPPSTLSRWNALLKSHFNSGDPHSTAAIFRDMLRSGARPNGITLALATRAFSCLGSLHHHHHRNTVAAVHSLLLQLGFGCDVFALNTLLAAYASSCNRVDPARGVFDELPTRDTVSWTVLINAYVRQGLPSEAMELFRAMTRDEGVVLDGMAFVAAFSACASLGDLGTARELERMARGSGARFDVQAVNALVDMYAKCGSVEEAQAAFDAAAVRRDAVTWNTLVTMYADVGDMVSARRIFDEVPAKNAVSWSALVSGYYRNGDFRAALDAFREMRDEGVAANNAAATCAIAACARLGAFDAGREVHLSLDRRRVQEDVVLSTALVDMYAKCGCVVTARDLFDEMPSKTLVSYNVMVTAMAVHGEASSCFQLFCHLLKQGLRPNSETFLGLLLGCAYAGWLDEGKDSFVQMKSVYSISPRIEHLCCMVHLVGGAGSPDEAFRIIKASPVTPDVTLWGALLSACNTHGNVPLGKLSAERMLELDPLHSGAYVQLCSIYAKANMWAEFHGVRKVMEAAGIRNRPGWSSFELDGQVHEFLAGDSSHPMMEQMLPVLVAMQVLAYNQITLPYTGGRFTLECQNSIPVATCWATVENI